MIQTTHSGTKLYKWRQSEWQASSGFCLKWQLKFLANTTEVSLQTIINDSSTRILWPVHMTTLIWSFFLFNYFKLCTLTVCIYNIHVIPIITYCKHIYLWVITYKKNRLNKLFSSTVYKKNTKKNCREMKKKYLTVKLSC